jgi:hypothetical protein
MQLTVAFTAFNRPDYLARTLRSWGAAYGRDRARFRFQAEPGHASVHRLCREFPGAQVAVNEQLLGPQRNPQAALAGAFRDDADFVILAEDDIVVGRDVLDYFSWAAAHFAGDSGVLAVSAFRIIAPPLSCLYEARAERHFPGLVWGTWRDRWTDVLEPSWDLSGWDLYINRELVGRKGYEIVLPHLSRSQHIGAFGAHMTPVMFEPGQSKCFVADAPSGSWRCR